VIPVTAFAGRRVAVLGLGRSGRSAVRALQAGGATVCAWDDDAERRRTVDDGINVAEPRSIDWSAIAALVVSPGVPLTHPTPHPVVRLGQAAGCEILGDVELLARSVRGPRFAGITGTNGKSTTTALLGHLLSIDGRNVEIGGNLGVPALDLAPLANDGIYVLEMSSYQLDLTVSLSFDVAVLLNVSADHIDRHGSFAGYVAAKKRIFRGHGSPRHAIVGVDDPTSEEVFREIEAIGDATPVPISASRSIEGGVFVEDGRLMDGLSGAAEAVADLAVAATLPGAHNWQNAAAAYAAARVLGVAPDVAARGLMTFAGLPHRLEQVAEIDRVRYVNDSKATNADAAARALASYDNIFWIAGGLAKEGGIAGLEPLLGRVRHAFLIGEAAPAFESFLEGKVPVTASGTLPAAVEAAHHAAQRSGVPDPVVLLSPACASFDQFSNYEARGDAFKALVLMLPGNERAYGPQAGRTARGDAA